MEHDNEDKKEAPAVEESVNTTRRGPIGVSTYPCSSRRCACEPPLRRQSVAKIYRIEVGYICVSSPKRLRISSVLVRQKIRTLGQRGVSNRWPAWASLRFDPRFYGHAERFSADGHRGTCDWRELPRAAFQDRWEQIFKLFCRRPRES